MAADPTLACVPPDVPPGALQTGALELPAAGPLDAGIEAFLQGGEPPVYVGFGSMPDRAASETGRLVAEALALARRRAIVCAGWSGLELPYPQGEVMVVREAPHALLLPGVAVAVHHGGAGTTAAALRAGVPQVVVPHLGDQFFHGQRVRNLGVGPDPIPRGKLPARRLATAIEEAHDPRLRERAQDLGRQSRLVDGVAATAGALPGAMASQGA